MRSHFRTVLPLLAATALVALAWVAGPELSGPPLYDGLGFPDEPYRYVDPPANAPRTGPPTTATAEVAVRDGRLRTPLKAASAEQGPQVEVVIAADEVVAPPGASTVRLRVQPVKPTSHPAAGAVWGNVYRVTLSSDKGPVQLRGGPDAATSIALRAPADLPRASLHYRDSSGWHPLSSVRLGHDRYRATLLTLGDYAAVAMPAPTADEDSNVAVIVVLAGSVVLLAGVALLTRRVRAPQAVTPDRPIDVAGLRKFAESVHRAAPAFAATRAVQQRLVQQADRLLAELEMPEPSREELRTVVDDLIDTLRAGPADPSQGTAMMYGGLARQSLS